MEELKPNSYRYNESKSIDDKTQAKPEKEEKVISGKAGVVKKSVVARVVGELFSVDDIKNFRDYLIFDVVIPRVKRNLVDCLTDGIDAFFYGQNSRGTNSGNRSSSGPNRIPYNSISSRSTLNGHARTGYSSERSPLDYDQITYPTKADAETVLSQMIDKITVNDHVLVGEMFDLSFSEEDGVHWSASCYDYGWDNLAGVDTKPYRGQWIIDVPRPIPKRDFKRR